MGAVDERAVKQPSLANVARLYDGVRCRVCWQRKLVALRTSFGFAAQKRLETHFLFLDLLGIQLRCVSTLLEELKQFDRQLICDRLFRQSTIQSMRDTIQSVAGTAMRFKIDRAKRLVIQGCSTVRAGRIGFMAIRAVQGNQLGIGINLVSILVLSRQMLTLLGCCIPGRFRLTGS